MADCHRCRVLGWIAESVDIEPLRFVHLRPQGASHKRIWTGAASEGIGQYFMGKSASLPTGGGSLSPALLIRR